MGSIDVVKNVVTWLSWKHFLVRNSLLQVPTSAQAKGWSFDVINWVKGQFACNFQTRIRFWKKSYDQIVNYQVNTICACAEVLNFKYEGLKMFLLKLESELQKFGWKILSRFENINNMQIEFPLCGIFA